MRNFLMTWVSVVLLLGEGGAVVHAGAHAGARPVLRLTARPNGCGLISPATPTDAALIGTLGHPLPFNTLRSGVGFANLREDALGHGYDVLVVAHKARSEHTIYLRHLASGHGR